MNAKSPKRQKLVKICPKCGSKNVEYTGTLSNKRFFLCKSCGFASSNFPDIPQKFADRIKENPYLASLKQPKGPFPINVFLIYLLVAIIIIIILIISSRFHAV